MKVILIDIARCSGCMNCQIACKDEHCGNDWRPYAAPQPMTGQFWCMVREQVRGTRPKVKIHYVARLCAHCADAPCEKVCSAGAFHRREDGLVLIDPALCTGCGRCADACPIGAIYLNRDTGIAQKCTGCAHLLDDGHSLPRCVEACPTDAMRVIDDSELPENAEPAVDGAFGGRLYYINRPGRFIAGTVYDPQAEEVLIGAKCTLTDGEHTDTVQTDGFGDFWFRDLPERGFELTIEAEGYAPRRFPALDTHKDVNLGDIAMTK